MSKGCFEKEIVNFIKRLNMEGYQFFIDVGAHHGYFTCLAQRIGMQTVSIEADPMNFRVLKKNLLVNNLDARHIFNLGASDRAGTMDFYGFSTGVSSHPNWSRNVSRRKFRAKTITIDTLIDVNWVTGPLIMKIDVEGHEKEVLRGAKLLLERGIPIWVICEISSIDNRKKDVIENNVFSFMKSLGYKAFQISIENEITPFFPIRFNVENFTPANYLFKNEVVSKS
jgi:FkbM family methyltransferase